MKTYAKPVVEIAKFERVNIVTDSIPFSGSTGSVGSRERYDDDDDL